MAFIPRARRAAHHLRGLIEQAVTKAQALESVNDERVAIRPAHRPAEAAGRHLKGMDPPIPKAAHQEPMAETAQTGRGEMMLCIEARCGLHGDDEPHGQQDDQDS
jgi:hypothetical protein